MQPPFSCEDRRIHWLLNEPGDKVGECATTPETAPIMQVAAFRRFSARIWHEERWGGPVAIAVLKVNVNNGKILVQRVMKATEFTILRLKADSDLIVVTA